ncbi:hypothetical protein HID58_084918 [Brassica napus]|uniref:Uncharacterized protein n=1 Tax=Brassica napus TaxID=3708 RepID=A0ABQ7XL50_BRANA|nr:hypothetical protein HID58_084918 [Brassica napus]
MDRHPAPTMTLSVLTALLHLVAPSPSEEGSKSTTIDDSLCPDGVYSVCSCLLLQKNDLNSPQSTTLSVLIVSLPSSLVFSRSSRRLLRWFSSSPSDVKRLTLYELSTAKHFFRLSPFYFVDLLHSRQDSVPFPYEGFSEGGDLGSSQLPVFSTQATETSSFCVDIS